MSVDKRILIITSGDESDAILSINKSLNADFKKIDKDVYVSLVRNTDSEALHKLICSVRWFDVRSVIYGVKDECADVYIFRAVDSAFWGDESFPKI